jgi:prepilin-type N-terminal cleavage/methylation domain-containing protein
MRKTHSGFTLIELLVVVLIIGILAAGAIPQYFKVVERSRVTEAKTIFHTVRSAQESVISKSGKYADNWDAFDIVFKNYGGGDCTGPAECVQKTYTYMLDKDGSVYATRNAAPSPPAAYGIYTLIYDINSGETTCTQANCILDLL